MEPIKLRLMPRAQAKNAQSPREAFWRAMNQEDDDYNHLEGRICRSLGPELHHLLLDHLSAPVREAVRNFYGRDLDHLEEWLFLAADSPKYERGWEIGSGLDALARIFEQRRLLISEIPGLVSASNKIAAMSSVTFGVKVTGYSSLNLDLSIGAIHNLAKVFDKDFDSFRIFLEAFVPQAYGRIYDFQDAMRLECEVHCPRSVEQVFNTMDAAPLLQSAQELPVAPPMPTDQRRAEWLWRLANGSLLLPILLSMVVLYFAMTLLQDIGKSQQSMMSPIFEHQMQLLEEDRRRLIQKQTSPETKP